MGTPGGILSVGTTCGGLELPQFTSLEQILMFFKNFKIQLLNIVLLLISHHENAHSIEQHYWDYIPVAKGLSVRTLS